MEQPKVGDRISLWVEGEVIKVEQSPLPKGKILVTVRRMDDDYALCSVGLSALEPRSPFEKPWALTLEEIIAQEHKGVS